MADPHQRNGAGRSGGLGLSFQTMKGQEDRDESVAQAPGLKSCIEPSTATE